MIEERTSLIRDRYNKKNEYNGITKERYDELLLEGKTLKKYFDELCGIDTCKLLGIK